MLIHRVVIAVFLIIGLNASALAEGLGLLATNPMRSPLRSPSLNLNENCNPADPVDWLRSKFSALKFWREQQYDFESLQRSATKNLLRSRSLLSENRDGIADFQAMVAKRAVEIGFRGAKARQMMKDNMDEWNAIAKTLEKNVVASQKELTYANGCLALINKNLRKLGYLDTGKRGYNMPR